jgi:hypothetical protein
MNEDLKWLAENVHEWPERCVYATVSNWGNGPTVSWDCGTVFGKSFSRDQWQAAHDELSGKPSWDNVVGEWIAQDEDGEWYSFDNKPYHGDGCWDVNPCYREKYGKSEVLCDWRDTLERRPENHSVEPTEKVDHIPDAGKMAGNYIDEALEMFGSHYGDATEKVWRGPEDGLPPVGCDCEYIDATGNWHTVEITAIGRRGILFVQSGKDNEQYTPLDPRKFRPIRSEEDKAVEEMMKFAPVDNGSMAGIACQHMARQLYRAKYRKQEDE